MSYDVHNFLDGSILFANQLNDIDTQLNTNTDTISTIQEDIDTINTNKANVSDLTNLATKSELNTKADTTVTTGLQNQINSIITPATQDAEVINARVGVDGHSYSTLKERLDTEQTSVEEDLSEISNNVNELDTRLKFTLLNGIDTNNSLDGKYYNQRGGLSDSSLYKYSEQYVKIKPNTAYSFAYFNGTRFQLISYYAICFYDSNRHFISQLYDQSGIVSPSNAYWVRISYRTEFSNQIMFFEGTEIPEKYNPYGYITDEELRINTSINNIKQELAETTQKANTTSNAINEIMETNYSFNEVTNRIVTQSYFKARTGNDLGPYDTWRYETIDVEYGEVYDITACAGQSARLWLLLDNNNSVVSYSTDDTLVNIKNEVVTIPVNVTKMVVNESIQNPVQISAISIKKRVSTNYIKYQKVFVGNESLENYLKLNNRLYGKTLVCCGDSITFGADMEMGEGGFTDNPNIDVYNWIRSSATDGSWVKQISNIRMAYGYQIASRNNMTFYNGGISGSTIQGLSANNGFSLENGRYTKLPDNIDYLTIFFGWNDAAYGTLGTITDTTNQSYYGGYNVVLPYLINKYPYTKICLIVPFGATANHRNAVRLLANKYGLACFDMYQGGTPLYYGKESSVGVNTAITTANQQKFQANGAHPNYKGHTQIADMLENFLRGI